MNSVKEIVTIVINDFIDQEILFTALDVTNEVKKELPLTSHREVRDLVKEAYPSMQSFGYGRTTIQVFLRDGSSQDAFLYHSLADSWDLDMKYDTIKRGQISLPISSTSVIQAAPGIIPTTITNAAPLTPVNPKQMWDNLSGSTNLFPTT